MTKIYELVKELDFVRTAGSLEEDKAIKIITSHLDDIGLQYKLEPFEMVNYEPGLATIKCDDKKFDCYPFGLDSSQEISGELVFLENSQSLLFDNISYKGKIIISKTYSRKLVQSLAIAKPEAYIVIGNPNKDATTMSHRQKTYIDKKSIPSISISYKNGAELSKLSGKNITIKITQKVNKVTAKNIVVDIKGQGNDRNIFYAVGHYDTVGRAPGACDNTGGSAVLLMLAEHLVKNPPQRNLKLIWFSGEEMGLLGSQAYVKKHLDEIKNFGRFLVNIDVTGDDIGRNMYRILGTKETLGYIDGITRESGFSVEASLGVYSSDNMPFSVYEVPSLSIARFGGEASFHGHTKNDRLEFVTQRGLEITQKITIMILDKLLNAKIFPLKREIGTTLKKDILKYMWNLNMEESKLEWEKEYRK